MAAAFAAAALCSAWSRSRAATAAASRRSAWRSALRSQAPFLSVLCGAGLLPPAAGVLARLGVGSRWHGEAWAGCWEAVASVCACKGALYFLYALPIFYTLSSFLISATIAAGGCTMSTTTPCSGSSSAANWLASNPGGIKWP
jgi:hypothetical protein